MKTFLPSVALVSAALVFAASARAEGPIMPEKDPAAAEGPAVKYLDAAANKHPRLLITAERIPQLKAFYNSPEGRTYRAYSRKVMSPNARCRKIARRVPAWGQEYGLFKLPTVALHYVLTKDRASFAEVGGLPEMAGRNGRLDRGRRAGRGRHAGSLCQGHGEVEAVRAVRRTEQRYDRLVHHGRRGADVGLALQRSRPGLPRAVPPDALAARPRDVLRRPPGRQSRRRLLARRSGVQPPLVPRLGPHPRHPRRQPRASPRNNGCSARSKKNSSSWPTGCPPTAASTKAPATAPAPAPWAWPSRPPTICLGTHFLDVAVLSKRRRLRAGNLRAGHDRGPLLRRLLHQAPAASIPSS